MKMLKYILLSLAAIVAMTASAFEETLTFVNYNGSTSSFTTGGLVITFDESAHAVVTNDKTTSTIDLANVD